MTHGFKIKMVGLMYQAQWMGEFDYNLLTDPVLFGERSWAWELGDLINKKWSFTIIAD